MSEVESTHAERDRYVGAQPQIDRFQHALAHAGHCVAVGHVLIGPELGLPVPASRLAAVGIDAQQGRRGKELEAVEERAVGVRPKRAITGDEIPADLFEVGLERPAEQREDAFRL
jgi:hypothetical protein